MVSGMDGDRLMLAVVDDGCVTVPSERVQLRSTGLRPIQPQLPGDAIGILVAAAREVDEDVLLLGHIAGRVLHRCAGAEHLALADGLQPAVELLVDGHAAEADAVAVLCMGGQRA
ncbi:hypothetical protein SDC9_198768 [bioreactor metagenome]|uniref:Uncharacterized protein n=1 Tax=bioreactor metagenome TaxID=1076179 RepID=A0A645IJF6_9ZZZZ